MENKKSPKKEINKKRTLFLMLGLVVSLSLVLSAFEYKSVKAPVIIEWENESAFNIEDETPLTVHKEPKPPTPKVIKVIEVIEEETPEIEVEIDNVFQVNQTFSEPVFVEEPDEAEEEPEFVFAEQQATFPGGREAWTKFLSKNIRYPKQAKRAGIEGRVFLSFIVDTEGKVSDIKVDRGIGGGCDKEAIRVLEKAPDWNPGLQRGRPVKTRMSLFIVFKLK